MLSKAMEKSLKTFFSSPQFAVVGASSDPTKFGHKVFVWYLTHSLPVTPLNPRAPSITIASKTYPTLSSPSELSSPKETSLSVITPPKATLQVLKEAREVGIPAVWLQPGTFDEEVLKEAGRYEESGGVVIGGLEGGTGGEEGWCVLVDGEGGLSVAGRGWDRVRL
ncbi:CoA-binding protein [Venturia nashicola]|nr:CoA-binding protein [Venturia nashicola]